MSIFHHLHNYIYRIFILVRLVLLSLNKYKLRKKAK